MIAGFSMIGISMDDSPEPVVDFYRRIADGLPRPVGNSRLGEIYGGIQGLPTTFSDRRAADLRQTRGRHGSECFRD